MALSHGVLFQHFHYPTPELPADRPWWRQARTQLAELAHLGVWGVWHPVPCKGGGGRNSMGYDPYDLYDLGSKDQRGTVPTRFGTRDDYLAYVATAHANGLRVIADVVLNHSGGADQAQPNPVMETLGLDEIPDDTHVPPDHFPPGYPASRENLRSWTGFYPKGADGQKGTGRFPRDARHFHPTHTHPDQSEPYHKPYFGGDYCFEADSGYVGESLIDWAHWFLAQSGVDGFRLDAVKLMEPGYLRTFAAAVRKAHPELFLVGEFWDTNQTLLADFQSATQNQLSLFDFEFFYALKDLTEKPNPDLRDLLRRRFADRARSVTFVSNHDVDREQAIDPKKRALPYALMLALSGQPSVFYLDYFANPTLAALLRQLIPLHNRYATGAERVVQATPQHLLVEREGGLLASFWTTPTPPSLPETILKKRTQAVSGPSFAWYTPSVSHPLSGGGMGATVQTFAFDDDLDTGRLGERLRTVAITAAAGSGVIATLRGTYGEGSVLVEVRDAQGRSVAAGARPRGGPLTLTFQAPRTGTYRFLLSAPGNPTTATLTVRYTAPRE